MMVFDAGKLMAGRAVLRIRVKGIKRFMLRMRIWMWIMIVLSKIIRIKTEVTIEVQE